MEPGILRKFMYSVFVVLLTLWTSTTSAIPLTGEVKLFDPSGINIFSPPQPITGDLDLINNTLTFDPFLFFGFEWVTQSVELLGEGIHTRPDGSGGNISATVESGQAGTYIGSSD